MCEVVTETFNSQQKNYKITWEDVWNAPSIRRFPNLYLPPMYRAAKNGTLDGLLLSEERYAKIFIREILKED